MQQVKSCSLEPCKNDTILVSLNAVIIEEQIEQSLEAAMLEAVLRQSTDLKPSKERRKKY